MRIILSLFPPFGIHCVGQAVSEHAFAMTLMLIKKLHLYRSSQLKCRWEDHGMVTSLAGATVLVVGLGDIGLSYARLVKAMGARVIGVKRRSGPCPEDVDELCAKCKAAAEAWQPVADELWAAGHHVSRVRR